MTEFRASVPILEACELASVSRRTIYNWLRDGKLEYVRTAGGSVRIFTDSLFRNDLHAGKWLLPKLADPPSVETDARCVRCGETRSQHADDGHCVRRDPFRGLSARDVRRLRGRTAEPPDADAVDPQGGRTPARHRAPETSPSRPSPIATPCRECGCEHLGPCPTVKGI